MAYSLNSRLGAPLLAVAVLLLGACDQSPPADPSVSGTEVPDPAAPSEAVDPPATATEVAPPASSGPSATEVEEPDAADAATASSPAADQTETGQLAEETALAADTVVAARYSGTGADSSPIGVWAATPEACERIDQEDGPSEFLIVTPSSLRDSVSNCTVSPGDISDAVPFTATCIADGQSEERELLVDLVGTDTLHYQQGAGDEDDLEFVRCNL